MIHFVYAGYPGDPRIQSPYCITNNLYNYLSKRAEVKYYEWTSRDNIQYNEDDIILGHPFYDQNTPTQLAFANPKPCRAKCLIHPLHHARPEDNFPFDGMARKADKIFSICGPYWYNTLESSKFAHWKPKITRLDMAVDLNVWPYRKEIFNAPRNRRLLYVGSSMPQKNLSLMHGILKELPHVAMSWYGGSSDHPLAKLPNVTVYGWQAFTPETVKDICNRHDLFLNTSYSDANPTTLLEFCLASGVVPICTEASGYHNDSCFINIPQDRDGALAIVKEWLKAPPEKLRAISLENRRVCEEVYTWDKFCSTVWNGLTEYV